MFIFFIKYGFLKKNLQIALGSYYNCLKCYAKAKKVKVYQQDKTR